MRCLSLIEIKPFLIGHFLAVPTRANVWVSLLVDLSPYRLLVHFSEMIKDLEIETVFSCSSDFKESNHLAMEANRQD